MAMIGNDQRLRFTLTEQHVALLRRMYVGWQDCESGAPEIDPKRPYGSSSVFIDLADILDPAGWDTATQAGDDALDAYEAAHKDEYWALHYQTQQALQIVLRTGGMTPGIYEADRYRQDWAYVGPAEATDAAE